VLDLWKAAWDGLIWKAMISKAKATERELNRNPLGFSQGRSQSYPPADQRESPTLLLTFPSIGNTNGTRLNMSSSFAIGAIGCREGG